MKKRQLILLFALAPGVLFISSCSSLFYAPTSQTVHLFEKQGDIAASGTLQSTPFTISVAGDMAYTMDNKIFINANYQYFENPNGKAEFLEFGMGYYRKVGKYGFLESSLLYGNGRGLLEFNPKQVMYFSMHAPSVSGIIGIKNKYLFASLGLKGGLFYKNESSYVNTSNANPLFTWYMDDPGVYAFEYMRYAAFTQFTGTIGVKFDAVSLSYFNSVLAGPKAYGTTYRFQADQIAGGLRLQVNLNVLR